MTSICVAQAQPAGKNAKPGLRKAGDVLIGVGIPGSTGQMDYHYPLTFSHNYQYSWVKDNQHYDFKSKDLLQFAGYINCAYYLTNRFSVGADLKFWQYSHDWVLNNAPKEHGFFNQLAAPVYLHYDFIRQKKWYVQLGSGMEFNRTQYHNWGDAYHVDSYNFLIFWTIPGYDEFEIRNDIRVPEFSLSNLFFVELSAVVKINNRWSASLQLMHVSAAQTNFNQIGVNYLLFETKPIPFKKFHLKKTRK